MADQGIPPEMMAALQGQAAAQNGGAAAPSTDPLEALADQCTEALLTAIKAAAAKSAMAGDSAAECKDFADAALKLAQAVVVLDPELDGAGRPLEHELAMEQARAQGQVELETVRGANALEQAKAQAAAPSPAKGVKP